MELISSVRIESGDTHGYFFSGMLTSFLKDFLCF